MVRVHKDGLVEVRVRKKGTQECFPEVEHDGQAYVVAEPGQDFEVVVKLIKAGRPATGSRPRKDSDRLRVWLTVDGQRLGYGKVLSLENPERVFLGFCMHIPARPETVKSFEFRAFRFDSASQAHQPGHGATSVASAHAGHLKVDFQWSKATGIMEHLKPFYVNCPSASGTNASKEDKKFFMEPSLCCKAGHRELRQTHFSKTKYKTLSSHLVMIRYETAATLLLRKVLDPRIPAHKVILTASGLHQPAQQGAAGNLGARIKREREEVVQTPLRLRTATDKRICGKDETVHCDLTGDGPVWEIRKKPRPREVIEL